MPQITEIFTHAQDALARLAQQYKNSPLVAGLQEETGVRAQTVETVLWEILSETGISPTAWGGSIAQGAQLDMIGRLINCPRNSTDDGTYLVRLTAWVLVLLSSGTINQILRIFGLFFGVTTGLNITEAFPAAFIMETIGFAPAFDSLTNPQNLATADLFLQMSKAAGVGAQLHYSLFPVNETFTYGDVAGYSSSFNNGLGYDSNGHYSGVLF